MPADTREHIRARQTALVESLVHGADPPVGFESRRRQLRAAAAVLARKRAESGNRAKARPRYVQAGRFVAGAVAATLLIVALVWASGLRHDLHPLRTHNPRTKLVGP